MFRLPSLVRLLDECQSSFERLLAPPANLETLPTEERTIAEVSFLGMLRKKMTPGGMELNRSFFVFDVFFFTNFGSCSRSVGGLHAADFFTGKKCWCIDDYYDLYL